jgi:hypothetical protein
MEEADRKQVLENLSRVATDQSDILEEETDPSWVNKLKGLM